MRRERPFLLSNEDAEGIKKRLRTEEIGAWFTLVGAAWMNGGSLPDDDAKLAEFSRATVEEWRRLKPKVLAEFHRDEDGEWMPNLAVDQFTALKREGLWIDDDDYEDKVMGGRLQQ